MQSVTELPMSTGAPNILNSNMSIILLPEAYAVNCQWSLTSFQFLKHSSRRVEKQANRQSDINVSCIDEEKAVIRDVQQRR